LNIVVRRDADVADFPLPLGVVKAEPQFEFPWGYLFVLMITLLLVLVYALRHWSRTANPVAQSAAK